MLDEAALNSNPANMAPALPTEAFETEAAAISVDLLRFSREPAHCAASLSNMAGLTKSSAEWRRTGL